MKLKIKCLNISNFSSFIFFSFLPVRLISSPKVHDRNFHEHHWYLCLSINFVSPGLQLNQIQSGTKDHQLYSHLTYRILSELFVIIGLSQQVMCHFHVMLFPTVKNISRTWWWALDERWQKLILTILWFLLFLTVTIKSWSSGRRFSKLYFLLSTVIN